MSSDTTARRALVPHLLLAALALTTLASVALERAWWPVVHYPMFSRLQTRAPATGVEIYEVHGDREAPLPAEQAYFSRDFDAVGVRTVVASLARREGERGRARYDGPKLRRFLEHVLAHHPRNGTAHAPTALRLYRETRSFAAPTDPRPRVTNRRFLVEVGRAP